MSGEILFKDAEENSVNGVEAIFILPVRRKTLWHIITDYKHFPEYFDNVEKIDIIHEDKKGAVLELRIKSILKTFDYTVDRSYDVPFHKLSWKRISGDFKTNNGSWEIEDTPDKKKCIVKYRTFVQLDGFLGSALNGLARPETIKRIKTLVAKLKVITENET
ncbi:MAG: hypothetical protein OEV66_04130 [Spirochaetia bacterium]|nr:hypothetical protein [Spirochaetia bacterium]